MRRDQKVLKSFFWLRFSLDRFQRSCYFQICQWNFCYALCWMLEELQCFLCARYLRLHIKACKLHSYAENCCWLFSYWISPQAWASVEHHLSIFFHSFTSFASAQKASVTLIASSFSGSSWAYNSFSFQSICFISRVSWMRPSTFADDCWLPVCVYIHLQKKSSLICFGLRSWWLNSMIF